MLSPWDRILIERCIERMFFMNFNMREREKNFKRWMDNIFLKTTETNEQDIYFIVLYI